MSHDIGNDCCRVCENCGVVFCTEHMHICPVCGTVPWIYRKGAKAAEFNVWLEKKLSELQKEREVKK